MPNIKVISKYFSSGIVMDDSLSEFQEKKKFNTGPKKVRKQNNKAKKIKHVKGQKDIRTLVKNKQSEVVTYSKDFDKVCKQAGLDVDPEQLQLAIALSKSLQTESVQDSDPHTKYLSSQQRTLKIRTTLQEYGFKVPKTKITTDTSKRKGFRKPYKLLLTSQSERQQIISDKYAQILANNFFESPVLEVCNNYDQDIYYKSSNISYELIKNDDVYFIDNLFSKHMNKNHMLKDWSKIPGRPLSPKLEVSYVNFDSITCTQDELDSVLSGSLMTAQRIVREKCINTSSCEKIVNLKLPELDEVGKHLCVDINKIENSLTGKVLETQNMLAVSQNTRSVSPDLFDDEVSIIVDSKLSQQTVSNDQTCHMDFTECVNVENSGSYSQSILKVNTNVTKRKSNDFMDITDCVTNCKQINIDLTSSCYDGNPVGRNNISPNVNIDLTQTSDDDLPFVKVCSTEDNVLENTIILNNSENNSLMIKGLKNLSHENKKELVSGDIIFKENFTKENIRGDDSIKKDSTSSFLFKSGISCGEQKSSTNNFSKSVETDVCGETSFNMLPDVPNKILVLQNKPQLNDDSYNKLSCVKNTIAYMKTEEENSFILEDNGNFSNENTDFNNASKNYENDCFDNNAAQIDLTQSSDSPKDTLITDEVSNSETYNLFEKDISTDNDEMFDEIVKKSKINISQTSTMITKCKEVNSATESKSTSGNISEVYDISDDDLNFSINKSTDDSNVANVSATTNWQAKDGNHSDNCKEFSNYFLPFVEIEGKSFSPLQKVEPQNLNIHNDIDKFTPKRGTKEKHYKENAETPTNNGYVVKVNDVTPMVDYASMSSPERNKELEKYGLKPFKRKRAIQLLTYLYNQTHPLIESLDDCPSPSKRQKIGNNSMVESFQDCLSPTKHQKKDSPRKHYKSPKKTRSPKQILIKGGNDVNEENYLYTETKHLPDIKNIECDEEDWVFQKREKAKVHACRVPLHIALHNYVSCRQKLREAILQYEPVNIDIIQKDLAASGHKYNPKDLLKFLDKKCITVKTADNNARNRKS